MFRVRVEKLLHIKISSAFKVLTHHAGYDQFPGCSKAELLREGDTCTNGTGAIRRIELDGGVVFVERIERFEEPTCFEYRIIDAKPFPMTHLLGRVSLSGEGDATRVVWISEGHIAIPLLGHVIDRLVERLARRLFSAVLRAAERSQT